MKKQLRHWRRLAALVGATALVVGVTALVPASSMAATSCPNKQLKFNIEGNKFTLPVKAVSTEGGVSCAKAYEVIKATLSGEPPAGWKSYGANFTAPEGLIPQAIKNGSKKIKFATRGG